MSDRRPVEEVVEGWPCGRAFDVLDLHREGRLTVRDVRRLDYWQRHLEARGSSFDEPVAEDFRTFGSCTRLRALAGSLAEIDGRLSLPARDVISEKELAKRGREERRGRGRCRGDGPAPSLSLPEASWPAPWRRAMRRLRDRADGDDLDLDDDGPELAGGSLAAMAKAVGQLARIVVDESRQPILSLDLVDGWRRELASRGLAESSKATWLELAALLGRELGADDEVVSGVLARAEAHRRRGRGRSRKEQRFLDLDLGIGDVFERARELHERALRTPPHQWSSVRDRLEAGVIALSVAAPLRCGDLQDLRIGRDVVRTEADGWWIETGQEKTGVDYESAALWEEVGAILDDLVVRGSGEDVATRVEARRGTPLFAWGDDGSMPVHREWPSVVWRKHFGVGVHMVRTLWASHYADHDPARSWAATALLGHTSERTRRHYEIRARRTQAVATCQDIIEDILPNMS